MENLKQCPFCGEMIKQDAKKCRYCGEWLSEPSTPNTPSHEDQCHTNPNILSESTKEDNSTTKSQEISSSGENKIPTDIKETQTKNESIENLSEDINVDEINIKGCAIKFLICILCIGIVIAIDVLTGFRPLTWGLGVIFITICTILERKGKI